MANLSYLMKEAVDDFDRPRSTARGMRAIAEAMKVARRYADRLRRARVGCRASTAASAACPSTATRAPRNPRAPGDSRSTPASHRRSLRPPELLETDRALPACGTSCGRHDVGTVRDDEKREE